MRNLNIHRIATYAAAFTTIALAPFTAQAQPGSTSSDDVAALREQIRLLDQKLRVVERNIELKDEAAAAEAKKQPKVNAGPGGFGLTSADKSFDLRLKALAQFDARFFLDDGAANRNGFFLRRIRLPFTGTVSNVDFNVTPELGANATSSTTSTVGLIDAWFNVKLAPAFNIKAGRFVSPVALEPGANRHFIESPFVNALLPNRDIGVEANGTVAEGFVDYRLGVFNGTRNNTQAFSSDEADGDKTVAGRLTVLPLKKLDGPLSKLSFGLGASIGNQRGVSTAGGASGLQNIVTNGQQTLLTFGTASTGTGVIANGEQVHISPSIEWYTGTPWSFVAEYAYEKQDYAGYSAGVYKTDFTGASTAWRATVGYVLTGEEATKAGVTPASAFNLEAGTWGAFEIVGRVSGLDLAGELFDTNAQGGGNLSKATNATGAFAYGTGVNWYLNKNLRLLVNVEKTEFAGGGSTAASNSSGSKSDELYVFSRLQLSF